MNGLVLFTAKVDIERIKIVKLFFDQFPFRFSFSLAEEYIVKNRKLDKR